MAKDRIATNTSCAEGDGATVQVDRARGVVVFTIHDAVSFETLIAAFDLFRTEPRDFHLRGFVWDLRNSNLSSVDLQTLKHALPHNTVAAFAGSLVRSAAVVNVGADRGVADLWVAIGTVVDSMERKVFHDLDAACDWIGNLKDGGLPPKADTGWDG